MTGRLNVACSYGSLELKRCYQKNLGWGITLAAALHIIIIGGFVLYADITAALLTHPAPPSGSPVEIDVTWTPPPPISYDEPEQVTVAVQTDAFRDIIESIGIPNPVPDTEAALDATLPTQDELSALANQSVRDLLSSGAGNSIVIKTTPEEYFPPPGKYVHTDEEPVPVNEITPEYPPLARQAGIEGEVLVEVLVDKSGNVRDVRITRPSGSSAGFEEATIKAAYQTKWKPAISNHQPVAVRVSYSVRFRLR